MSGTVMSFLGKFAVIGPTHSKLEHCIFLNVFDTLKTNVKFFFRCK